jgi:hypothetical protein
MSRAFKNMAKKKALRTICAITKMCAMLVPGDEDHRLTFKPNACEVLSADEGPSVSQPEWIDESSKFQDTRSILATVG